MATLNVTADILKRTTTKGKAGATTPRTRKPESAAALGSTPASSTSKSSKKGSKSSAKSKPLTEEQKKEYKETMDRLFDYVKVPKRRDKLDEEGLLRMGFTAHEDTQGLGTVYRIKPAMYYHPMIQVQLRTDLPRTNPNCGIVSIYSPEITDKVITNEGEKQVTFPERITPIAWYVDTYDRLFAIINSLIQINLK
jgi:hypothetical protein